MAIELLNINIDDVGVIRPDLDLPGLQFSKQSLHSAHHKIIVEINDQGDYTIIPDMLPEQGHVEFYTNDQKILDWHCQADGQLTIQAFTKQQINILADIKAKKCQIKAIGSIFFEGKLQVIANIDIQAEALCFADTITSTGALYLKAQQGVGFLGSVSANSLKIDAAFIQQSADMFIKYDLDIVGQVFKQQSDTKIVTKLLRLLMTNQAEIAGDLSVDDYSYISSKGIIWGVADKASSVKLLGKSYVHFVSGIVESGAQIFIGDSQGKETHWFKADSQLLLKNFSKFHLFHTHFSAAWVKSQGGVSLELSIFAVERFQQLGTLHAHQSKMAMSKNFFQHRTSETVLKDTTWNCPLNSVGGQFFVDACAFQVDDFNMSAGRFEAKNKSRWIVSGSFLFDDEAQCTLQDIEVTGASQAQFLGQTEIQNTQMQADYIRAQESKIIIGKSKIRARHVLDFSAGADICESRIHGEIVKLKGTLRISDLEVFTMKYFDIISTDAEIIELYTSADGLTIEGGTAPEQVVFSKCSLTNKSLTTKGHVTIDESVIYGIEERKVSQTQQGLALRRSRFVTDGVFHIRDNSKLNLSEYSAVRSGPIYSEGQINAENSSITCQSFSQNNAELHLQSSTLTAIDGVYSQVSKMSLIQQSTVETSTFRQAKGSELTTVDSRVSSNQLMVTDSTSTVTSNASGLASKKFVALGRMALCNSLLLAEELFIFEQFDVRKSMLKIENEITAGGDAHLSLDMTQVSAGDIHNLGEITATNSVIRAENTVSVWSPSTMSLQGNSAVAAKNMVVAGRLTVETLAENIPEDKPDHTDKVQLIVEQQMSVMSDAKVTGNADLVIHTDEIENSGKIALSASLYAVGNSLINFGSIDANSIDCGFDDYVVNLGTMSASNITVHSNFINLFGGVFAKQSFSSAGFYGINFGLIAANNYNNSTLLSLNSGLITPNFSGDMAYIFSLSNLTRTIKTITTMVLPDYTNAVNLAFMLPGLVCAVGKAFDAYDNFSWDDLKKMRRHQLMPLLGQVKDTLMFTWGACNSAYSINSEFANLGSDITNLFNFENYSLAKFWAAAADVNWQRVGSSLGTVFLGSYTDNALIDVNIGGSFAACMQKTSVLSFNTGAEASLLGHTINTHFLFNEGLSIGSEAVFLANSIYNAGTMEGARQLTVKADKMVNTGLVDGTNVNVAITSLEQDGQLTLRLGQAKIGNFQDTTNATTHLTELLVSGDNFHVLGRLEAKQVQFKYTGEVAIQTSASAELDNIWIEGDRFTAGGQLNYQHVLAVKANEARFERGSVVNGAKTDEDKLFVAKEVPAGTTTEDTALVMDGNSSQSAENAEKEFKPEHVLMIEANHAELNGRITGGDFAKIEGRHAESVPTENAAAETKKCESLTIGDEASIELKHGAIASQKAEILGHVDLEGFNIDVANTQVSENGVYKLANSTLVGDSLESKGQLDAETVQFRLTGEFSLQENAASKMDNVSIESDKVKVDGQLGYQHTLSMKANEVQFANGSSVNGAKTAEDQLFVPVAPTAEAAPPADSGNGEAAQQSTEPQKEFKPQNVLIIEANRVEENGRISGGDYTKIQGKAIESANPDENATQPAPSAEVAKCEQFIIGEDAEIDAKYGAIASQEMVVSGQARVNLDSFTLDIPHAKVASTSNVSLTNSVYTGDSLKSEGTVSLDHCSLKIAEVDLAQQAVEHINNSTIEATVFRDSSKMEYQGHTTILTNHYEHDGVISHGPSMGVAEDKNLFYVQANSADLHGAGDLDNAFYDIAHFNLGADFVAGRGIFNQYRVSDSFGFETADSFRLSAPISRACDIMVKASDISWQTDVSLAHRLSLISTVGDVALLSNISATDLFVQSARNIWMNHTIYSNSVASFVAEGGFYNLGGTLNAETAAVKASEIKNISAGSNAAQWSWGYAVGSAGIINGRKDTFLEATQGNIENYGGVIRGGEYTQLIAHGDVINNCNIRSVRGAYDTILQFDGGLIAGGTGAATDGIGLYVKAGGRILSDASDFISNGSNYLEADKGFSFTARQQTYVAERWTTKKWYGKKEHHEATATTVKGSVVQSSSGVNILRTEHGGLTSVATKFLSPGGTEIFARDNVQLYSLKSTDYTSHSKSSFWGLSKHESHHKYQSSTPTLFWDNGVTRITSTGGSIDARGAYFVGAGDLFMKAKGRIQFGLDILDHELSEKSQTFGFSVPVLSAIQAGKQSGKWMDAVTAEDATVAKLDAMLHSSNSAELLANTTNLGINLFNTTNSAMRGLANGTLSDELMARYGLGGSQGFSPALTFSMTRTKTETKYQTLGQGGVDRGGNVVLEAGEGIDLENGVRVHANGNMEVNAPEISLYTAELHSSTKQKTTTESVSVNPLGQVQDASFGYSKNSTQATQHVNAELSAGGNMKLHCQGGALHSLGLFGGRVEARTLDAQIDRLTIIDQQDTLSSHVESVSASVSGQVSAYQGTGQEKVTNQHSGIHVVEGINTNGHSVHVTEATMEGGEISTEGKNDIAIDHLTTRKVIDDQRFTGYGISGNVNDLQRLAGGVTSNAAGEQAVAIAEISVDHSHRIVEQTPVIYGARGTAAEIQHLDGELHTSSAVGSRTLQDEQMHLKFDVPVTNRAHLAQSMENIRAGEAVIVAALANPKPSEDPSNPLTRDEPAALPSKRREDELEHTEDDLALPPDLAKKLAQEVQDLKYASVELKQEIAELKAAIQDSAKATGKANPKLLHQLETKYKQAFIQTAKLWADEMWGELGHKLGPEYSKKFKQLLSEPDGMSKIAVKSWLSGKGLVINFIFNLGLASIDSEVDRKHVMQEALQETGKEVLLNIGIRLLVGAEAAGPVGLFYSGFGIFDTVTYNENMTRSLFEQSQATMRNSQTAIESGEFWSGIAQRQQAIRQFDAASQACAFHMFFSLKPCFSEPKSVIPSVSKI